MKDLDTSVGARELHDEYPVWEKPVITVKKIDEVVLGDPTISDDGLGDGLFS